MAKLAKRILDQLCAQKNEPHVSIYLPQGEVSERKKQLTDSIAEATFLLSDRMKKAELDKLMAPLRLLVEDESRGLDQLRDSLAIFRTGRLFRIVSVPLPVPGITVVSKSFHLKPLIRWAQIDHSFFLVGMDAKSIHLFRGNLQSIHRLDSSPLPPLLPPKGAIMSLGNWYLGKGRHEQKRETISTFVTKLSEWVPNLKTRIFLAGNPRDCALFSDLAPKLKVQRTPISNHFHLRKVNELHYFIRQTLEKKTHQRLQQVLLEYYEAEEQGLGSKDLQVIAREAAMGNIRRLFIAQDVHLWGRFDSTTGAMTIRPTQMDTQDEDILDDLAELVMAKGGEVLVSPVASLPKQRPALAILKSGRGFQYNRAFKMKLNPQLAAS